MSTFMAYSPLWIVALGLLLLMLTDALVHAEPASGAAPSESSVASGDSSELALGTAVVMFAGACFGWAMAGLSGTPAVSPSNSYVALDPFAYYGMSFLCVLGGLVSLLAGSYLPEHRIHRAEFYLLLGWSTLGAMALVCTNNLLTLFVALETMSLGTYCLVGLRRTARSLEAALKYYLLGSFASALLLFGMALLYGATGHTDFKGIAASVAEMNDQSATVPWLLAGATLVLVGLMFKIAAVPFHAWTPDAYEGAPTATTAYMAAVVKTGAFGILLRVLFVAFPDQRLMSWGAGWAGLASVIAVLTMTFANLVAARQSSVKRMLAYSSIAHAGYALIGVAASAGSKDAQSSVMLYLVAYSLSTLGAFGALMWAGSYGNEATSYDDLAGIGRRNPPVALALTLFVLSLAGIPPTAGFFGKLAVFKAAIDANLILLVVVGLINSVVAAYYYLKVVVVMYMQEPAQGMASAKPMRAPMLATALLITALLVLAIGMYPETMLNALARTSLAG
jgi:NADH-quinone oxidoreductase subunit N